MARMKFLCDSERCIECNACVTACKNEHEVPWGINRRRVVTINDGRARARKSISVACMHCSDAPCKAVCPVDCFYTDRRRRRAAFQGPLHRLRLLLLRVPVRRAAVSARRGNFGSRGKMDKCTFCAGGPAEEQLRRRVHQAYGRNRIWPRASCQCARRCARPSVARRRWRQGFRHLPETCHHPRVWRARLGLGHRLRRSGPVVGSDVRPVPGPGRLLLRQVPSGGAAPPTGAGWPKRCGWLVAHISGPPVNRRPNMRSE